ncbi:MAG TPA: hypothetical protein VFL14_00140 [Xanthomonadales bacterium]|nr:hypothetical protein [Xanthomonadales bacterium]
MDPERRSREAFWWPLRRVRGYWPATLGGAAAVFCAFHFDRALGARAWWLLGSVMLALALLPFGVLQRDVLARSDGAGWWRPRWIGFAALASFLLVVAATIAVASLRLPPGLDLPVAVVVGTLLEFLAAVVVIDRVSPLRLAGSVRQVARRDTAGMVLALWSRGALATAWLAAPLLLIAFFVVYDGTTLNVLLRRRDGPEGFDGLALPFGLADTLLTWGSFVTVYPIALYTSLSLGRLYVRSIAPRGP